MNTNHREARQNCGEVGHITHVNEPRLDSHVSLDNQ